MAESRNFVSLIFAFIHPLLLPPFTYPVIIHLYPSILPSSHPSLLSLTVHPPHPPASRPADALQIGAGVDVAVPCNEGEYQADTTDCTAYYLCVHGEWQKFKCQPKLLWDQVNTRCFLNYTIDESVISSMYFITALPLLYVYVCVYCDYVFTPLFYYPLV